MASLADIFPDGVVPSIDRLPSIAPDKQMIIAISEMGLQPPDVIEMDGQLHRFSTTGKKSDKTGWYVAYHGAVPAGAFGCWKLGIESTWRADIGRELSAVEQMQHAQRIREAKIQRDKAEAERKANAAIQAGDIWEQAALASDDHPYLLKKQIKNPGFKIASDGRLIAPLYVDFEVAGLQYIDGDGKKMFMSGSKSGGAFWWLSGSDKTIYIVEGVATAASVYEATGNTVIIAYSANNLSSVAKTVRDQKGITADIVIVADNDESGVGFKEAAKAAEIAKCQVIQIPELGDANDYVNNGHNLSILLNPPIIAGNDYLIDADEFAETPAPIKWLIKGWIQQNALIMIHGPSGGGKTFAVLDQILSIASNIKWADLKTNHGSVVYLAGEGHHGLKGRVAAWKKARGIRNFGGKLHISKAGTDLNTADGYKLVRDSILALAHKPSIIVVDTLHRFYMGDENNAQDAKTMLDACAALMREFDCSVLLVHHTGVNEESQHRARGSSAWRGALDIEISVIPAKEKGMPMQLVQRKSKDAELADSIWMMIKSVELDWLDEDGERVKSAVAELAEKDDIPETKADKEPKSISDARKCFESALIEFGRIDADDELFISDDAWSEWMRKSGQWENDSTRRSTKNRYKKTLLELGAIDEKTGGFCVINEFIFDGIRMIMANQ